MAIANLERFESVNLYSIHESQKVIELDSPALGCESTIVDRKSVYEFFHSQREAQRHIKALRKRYMIENLSLKVRKTREADFMLVGDVDHIYAHYFQIIHSTACQSIPILNLPENFEELLHTPRRRIVKAERTPTEFSHYLTTLRVDFDKIVQSLF